MHQTLATPCAGLAAFRQLTHTRESISFLINTTMSTHPLKTRTPADLELFLAQALTELTGTNATVTVDNMTMKEGMTGLGDATLQISVRFPMPAAEDGDVPFAF